MPLRRMMWSAGNRLGSLKPDWYRVPIKIGTPGVPIARFRGSMRDFSKATERVAKGALDKPSLASEPPGATHSSAAGAGRGMAISHTVRKSKITSDGGLVFITA